MKRAASQLSSLTRALDGGWLMRREPQAEAVDHAAMTAIGRLQDFPDLTATPLTLRLGESELAILVVLHGDDIRAWLDLCPHRSLPLTLQGGRVLSADGTRLRCSVHLAEFCAKEGHALTGGGAGMGLPPIPLRLRSGWDRARRHRGEGQRRVLSWLDGGNGLGGGSVAVADLGRQLAATVTP